MANITPTYVPLTENTVLLTWEAIGNADTGLHTFTGVIPTVDFPNKSVSIGGTFGSATVTIQGSNDGTVWHTCTYNAGTSLAVTAAAAGKIDQTFQYFRAISSGGTGTDVDVFIICTK